RSVFDGYFFCSSRRRHTRFSRDWSSDVCSSDLSRCPSCSDARDFSPSQFSGLDLVHHQGVEQGGGVAQVVQFVLGHLAKDAPHEIGRASCREGGETAGGGASWRRSWAPSTWGEA